jgi:hypothetical protein
MGIHNHRQPAVPDLHWDYQPVASTPSVCFLRLHLEQDLPWAVQIAKALRNGRGALLKFRHIRRNPRLNVDVRLLPIKTLIVPMMQFGMEVWLPRTKEETRGVPQLHSDSWMRSKNRSAYLSRILCIIIDAIVNLLLSGVISTPLV